MQDDDRSDTAEDGADDFGGGWDNRVTRVGRWVERTPRFPDREAQLRREAKLLPWLARQLPLPVPTPEVVSERPFTTRYAYLPGGPCLGASPVQGRAVGAFLRALHRVTPADAVRHGALDGSSWHDRRMADVDRMTTDVLPLLPAALRAAGASLLARLRTPPADPRVVHGDLGPEHLRVSGDRVTGIIDWGDSGVGDPAIDLAWTTYGASEPFARSVVAAYGASAALLARAHDLHLIGPWHEVPYGLVDGGPAYVESGLVGVVARLAPTQSAGST